ncbi:regulator of G protein signaling superfamily [Annulohypoxylon moriforme]|nr:regulator of G protein signaling superfamily [Annulohypoxylon moriforme]
MGKPRLRGSSPVYLNPSPTELSPPPSLFEDWDQETAMDTSRPTSLAIPRTGSPFSNPPSLTDILSNSAPPPWTLSSFMAFLSQNHCLETLEFILDADRYRDAFYQMIQRQTSNGPAQICSLWRKVIDAYIMPCAPREVNLPSHVRDHLLELPCCKASPPDPAELDEAVQIVRELINDSVLVPFLESVLPPVFETRMEEEVVHDSRQGRSRLRIPRDVSTSDEASTSPRVSYLPMFIMGSRNSGAGNRSTTASMETVDVDMMTDDSSSPHSSSGAEPMTPPTTPPTSDFTYNTSPSTLQRAISGNSWKKMGAKLGLTRKSKSTRRQGSTSTNQPSL